MDFTASIYWLSLGTILAQIVVVIGALLVVVKPASWPVRVVGKNALGLAFILSLVGAVGSLFLSEIAQFPPCVFCWYQRIALYPQVLLFGMALARGKDDVVDYSIGLSLAGAAIAGYQYYGQMFNAALLPCSASIFSPSCSDVPFVEFGYITIPMMSLTAFAVLLVLMMAHKAVRRR
ncbi:MAG: disulfide bond formation protein B [Patescibacteria group bacterium]